MEDIPDILRVLFKESIEKRYERAWIDDKSHGAWLYKGERFKARLNGNQISLLLSGNSKLWDVTLLVHVLLYSSHFLLVYKNYDDNARMAHNNNSKIVSKTTFTECLCPGNVLLIDIGDIELIKAIVESVSGHEIWLRRSINASISEIKAVYQVSQYWDGVDSLSKLRNNYFAHCKHARIDNKKLARFVDKVEKCYRNLNVPVAQIKAMVAIGTGKSQHLHALRLHYPKCS